MKEYYSPVVDIINVLKVDNYIASVYVSGESTNDNKHINKQTPYVGAK